MYMHPEDAAKACLILKQLPEHTMVEVTRLTPISQNKFSETRGLKIENDICLKSTILSKPN